MGDTSDSETLYVERFSEIRLGPVTATPSEFRELLSGNESRGEEFAVWLLVTALLHGAEQARSARPQQVAFTPAALERLLSQLVPAPLHWLEEHVAGGDSPYLTLVPVPDLARSTGDGYLVLRPAKRTRSGEAKLETAPVSGTLNWAELVFGSESAEAIIQEVLVPVLRDSAVASEEIDRLSGARGKRLADALHLLTRRRVVRLLADHIQQIIEADSPADILVDILVDHSGRVREVRVPQQSGIREPVERRGSIRRLTVRELDQWIADLSGDPPQFLGKMALSLIRETRGVSEGAPEGERKKRKKIEQLAQSLVEGEGN